MRKITCCLYREDKFYVAQCLNVDVSSCGETRGQALKLYFEDAPREDSSLIEEAEVGQELIHA